ncbi:arginine--tRNA ligase [candidate division NPL-UPA2 bacterium]|nr:arginine--tRNA ligase [candidate division NPL-UPA2 bacterium]
MKKKEETKMLRGIREAITLLIKESFNKAEEKGEMKLGYFPPIYLESPSREDQGDLATNIALQICGQVKLPPRKVAEYIVNHIEALSSSASLLLRTEVAGPGFINFFLKPEAFYPLLSQIEREKANYGRSNLGQGKRVLVEFVSANPTGPLTVAHGRHAAVGDVLANLLSMVGYEVSREYYYNDAGRQMALLGKSVEARYRQLLGEEAVLPEEGYQGDYLTGIAQEMLNEHGRNIKDAGFFRRIAEERIFEGIKKDLTAFGVKFDIWVKEGSFYESGEVQEVVDELKGKNVLYEQEGALWFRSSSFGDEKDRVIKKSDGQFTYLVSDIAYHRNKYKRGFHQLINILGPDHHGYIGRLQAAVEALGCQKESLKIIILQLVSLYRGKEKLRMSTRSGDFVTLRQVIDEVGKDAARFFFLMRGTNSHLNFDLELAKKESPENPVYYVQYAHARICSILKFAAERGVKANQAEVNLSLLKEEEELRMIKKLAQFPEVVETCVRSLEPQGLTAYLRDLAGSFHNFYNKFRVIGAEEDLNSARLMLIRGVKITLQNGLYLLGISAPEKM